MCVNPRLLNSGVGVPCRKCWQCRENTINDWVGRCIAEKTTAADSHAVTLTYGRDAEGNADHVRAAVLTYSDVQKWLKRLRVEGFPVRYFCVGEFGSAKGRAHWHIVLFWQKKAPKHVLFERVVQAFWDHGTSYWEPVNANSVRYNCKYIQKDLRDAERQRQIGMSKYPPLGAGYFGGLARRYVDQGLPFAEPSYHFPDVKDKHGETVKFRLRGASLDLFIATYVREWRSKYGGHPPHSDLVHDWEEKQVKLSPEVHPVPFKPRQSAPWIAPPAGAVPFFSDTRNCHGYELDGQTLWWSFDLKGERAWQSVIRTEAQADLLRAAYAERKTSDAYRAKRRG